MRLDSLPGSILLTASLVAGASSAQEYENLQVLPQDVSRDELTRVMLENLRGLGLPRRQNEGCLHCHVGNMEQPADTWDWASDDKPAKTKARAMMAMVDTINRDHLAKLDTRIEPNVTVTCYTCHAGRHDPRALEDVLHEAYADGGIDSAVTRYEELRARYYGADAYDFQVGVLAGMAFTLAGDGAFDDAVTLAKLNVDANLDEPAAREIWSQLRLTRTSQEQGIETTLSEFDQMHASENAGAGVLDGLGWSLYRQDQRDEALAVFRHNRARFPDDYIPNESLADALWFAGEHETAVEMFEAWLRKHPDHAMARRRLDTLRSEM